MTLVNLSHSSFIVRQNTIVKEVRWHRKTGKATVAGVVEIVTTMPCCGMEVAASVTSRVRALRVGSLLLRRGLGQGGVDARPPEGSGEAELAPEAKGSGEPGLAPDAKGSGEPMPAPEP